MEDCHSIHIEKESAFFGVFDGHGGVLVAQCVPRALVYPVACPLFDCLIAFRSFTTASVTKATSNDALLCRRFAQQRMYENLKSQLSTSQRPVPELLEHAYLSTDAQV